MAQSTSDTISTLNNLIETLKDGEEGFRQAADGVQNASLRSTFLEYAQQRGQYSQELQNQVTNLGKTPEQSGSVVASIHRGWINLKSALTGKDDKAILDECERGEDSAVKNYREALSADMPSDVRSVVERQATGIQQAHDRVRSLRNSAS